MTDHMGVIGIILLAVFYIVSLLDGDVPKQEWDRISRLYKLAQVIWLLCGLGGFVLVIIALASCPECGC